MKKVIIVHLVLLVCVGDGCISTFADLENDLLANPTNRHRISRAYFPLRREISPVCVTTYYYIGINSSSVNKLSCPPLNTSDEDERIGCSKWRWCINSFYMAIDLPQLQDLSFHIILDTTTDLIVELSPLCNNTDDHIIYQHFLRVTASVSEVFLITHVYTLTHAFIFIALPICQE